MALSNDNLKLPGRFPSSSFHDTMMNFFKSLGEGGGKDMPFFDHATPEDVRSRSSAMSKRIFADWNLLNTIMDKHEPAIHKRWAKKTKSQRSAILLKAWPKMSATHRPDFAAVKRESREQRLTGTKFPEAYKWPYVNLEDLSKPRTLLLFLQSRARNPPDAFAIVDQNAMRLGHVYEAIPLVWLNNYTMMFTDRTDPREVW